MFTIAEALVKLTQGYFRLFLQLSMSLTVFLNNSFTAANFSVYIFRFKRQNLIAE